MPENAPAMPRNIIIRGTVSRVVDAPANAADHWVDIYFKESPDDVNALGRSFPMFDVCGLGPDIFQDAFGAGFRTAMIGKPIEIVGQLQRTHCDGSKTSIRVTLAHQLRVVNSAEFDAATVLWKPPKDVQPSSAVTPVKAGAIQRDGGGSTIPALPPASGLKKGQTTTVAPSSAPPTPAPAQVATPARTAPDNSDAAAARAKALQEQEDRVAQQRAAAQQQAKERIEKAKKTAACRQQAIKDHPPTAPGYDGAAVQKEIVACIQAP
jgi:hypothetical protein